MLDDYTILFLANYIYTFTHELWYFSVGLYFCSKYIWTLPDYLKSNVAYDLTSVSSHDDSDQSRTTLRNSVLHFVPSVCLWVCISTLVQQAAVSRHGSIGYKHALKQSVNYNYIFIKLNPICATDHWHIYFFHNTMVNRNVHSVELQIYADSICNVVLDDITLWARRGNDFHRGFSDSPEKRKASDPVPLTLDLLNSKSIGLDTVSRTTTVPSFKSFWSGFSFYRVNIHTHTTTHIHRDKVIAISATYYVVTS